MEILLVIAFIAVLLGIFGGLLAKHEKEVKPYSYRAKEHLMTQAEENFFRMLSQAVSEKYLVFPQIHLSALLEHEIPGQDWTYAFRHINQKSVDYVLCDKITLKPVYAIELDDYTHRLNKDRFDRDIEVERIFADAKIPLVRFRDYSRLTSDDIINKLSTARVAIGA
jgi:hypothetical protein